MKPERFRWLAAVVYAHPNHKVVGRTRLQKEMRLLQRLGLKSDYDFRMHHYGPYSDGIQSDINLLERMNLVKEDEQLTSDGRPYSIFTATNDAMMKEVEKFSDKIKRMANEDDATVLELAATYDTFRSSGHDHERATSLLKRMKGDKCKPATMSSAFRLLTDLGLQSEPIRGK